MLLSIKAFLALRKILSVSNITVNYGSHSPFSHQFHKIHYRLERGACMQSKPFQPRLGVLVGKIKRESPTHPLGPTTTFAKELSKTMQQAGGIVYFFTPYDYDPNKRTVQSLTWDHGWNEQRFPLPHVIYNRLMSRKLEQLHQTKTLFKQAKSINQTAIFNEKYLDKNEVFSALARFPKIKHLLPHSLPYQNGAQLKKMTEVYSTLFIKPTRGSLGLGIIRIRKQQNGTFILHQSSRDEVKQFTFNHFKSMHYHLKKQLARAPYQIQQGIHVLHLHSRPVDFRILMHKDGHNKWQITSTIARVGGAQQIVSNVARGGHMKDARTVLNQAKLTNPRAIHKKIHLAAKQIAIATDKSIPGLFGEFGIDLAVDTRGRPYLLEVNAKPAKNNMTKFNRKRIRPSVKKIVAYSRYLASMSYASLKEDLS